MTIFSSILLSHMIGSFIVMCVTLLITNCLEKDYSLISLVLAMVKLVNMGCDKILNDVSFVYDIMWNQRDFAMFSAKKSFWVGGCPR